MKNLILTALISALLASCDNKKSEPSFKPLKENPKGDQQSDGIVDNGNWYIKDPAADNVEGVSSNKAIALLSLKNEKEIIVAVLDGGVDYNHEDLKGKIWQNPGETGTDDQGRDKATNGVDDDQNGYVDDIRGWNFLGGADGKSVGMETLEVTREMVRFESKLNNGETLTPAEKIYFEKVKTSYDRQVDEATKDLMDLSPIEADATPAIETLKEKLNLEDYSKEKLEAINSTDEDVLEAKRVLLEVTVKFRSVARFYRILSNTKDSLDYYLNKNFNPRAEIVGDDPNNFEQKNYGNNDIKGPEASHGTHVAGIIAAKRGNGIGVDGVAENVKIMGLRVVPEGDERDKDIALAVRYAVDNGAHIINMSFGKGFSPSKSKVDEAFLYAASKGVLLFHAAGNEAKNIDIQDNFPNAKVADAVVKNLAEKIPTWIEVGASSKTRSLDLPANFSNYGKLSVDLFSPGVDLNSTTPENTYAVYSGTSMASPCAAGVGALLLSNFPKMSAAQAKAILLNQTRQYGALLVRLPGSDLLDLPTPFAGLSHTGGVIDAFSSVILAKQLAKEIHYQDE